MSVAQRMSAREFLATEFDERWVELIQGEVVVNEPRWRHAAVATKLLGALLDWTRGSAGRGTAVIPIDVGVDEANVYAPDLLWYAEGHAPTEETPWPYPLPDLAVEIRSPSTWRYDVGAKKSAYERHGLPELWLVDTEARAVLVFRRSATSAATFDVSLELDRDAELTSPLLPGLKLPLGELFAG